ncbi:hypothetical protein C0Q70_02441 [Pomacea canaliculata]|uniref:C-type lectin domain-containing protein n=1 Tax=Pomacea canaliculata TaxID=400727 RepID=A0A2T7PPY5_POMCA|nr:hypothetical protein C0Q70_02441 [Pomacea canaliculata]
MHVGRRLCDRERVGACLGVCTLPVNACAVSHNFCPPQKHDTMRDKENMWREVKYKISRFTSFTTKMKLLQHTSPAHDRETSSSEYRVTGVNFLNKTTADLQVTTNNITATRRVYSDTGDFDLFSLFHALSALPQQLRDGRWNCSVPHWPDFRLHFPCNLVSDCVGGEDEVDCPYTSHVCAPGVQWTNGPCAQFVKADRKLSWESASAICKSRGMVLLSAPKPKDWEALMYLLHFHPYDYTYYGLRAAPLLMPFMYKGGLMWVDDIFAHYAKYTGTFRYGDCFAVILKEEYYVRQGTSTNCSLAISSYLLCEVPAPRDDTLPQMPVVKANWFLTNSYSTLKFLDAQGSGMSPKDLATNTMLVHLSLANCNISVLEYELC